MKILIASHPQQHLIFDPFFPFSCFDGYTVCLVVVCALCFPDGPLKLNASLYAYLCFGFFFFMQYLFRYFALKMFSFGLSVSIFGL